MDPLEQINLLTQQAYNNAAQKFALVVEVIDDFSSVDVWSEISTKAGNQYSISPAQVA